eukprot:TRINITY_DN1351_c0_g2_i2.p1 TRINITY_DN1351_c0_g2~~TRINITY_DN1351_c0_g2_i2.p1  ORF type:complete len:1015 (+),score=324.33 TRINITY_DN1351_c0_g2_i2:64-3045(+)
MRVGSAAALLAVSAGTSASDHLAFGYGWRFHLGDDAAGGPGPGTCEYERIDGYACTGMDHNPNRFSEQDCATACCYDPNCYVYQTNRAGNAATNCFHGGKDAVCTKGGKGALAAGGRRTSVPPIRRSSPFARADYNDAAWTIVDAPHDFSINGTFTDNGDVHHGYLPRNVSWYRKHFKLPASWKGSTVQVEFEGVFHFASVYLNGVPLLDHKCGYTGFTVRLDNATSLKWGDVNVMAVRADATFGSGHWYEGGGLYRPVHLHRLPPLHFTQDGVFMSPESDGMSAAAEAELERFSGSGTASVSFSLYDGAAELASCTTQPAAVTAQPSVQKCTLTLAKKATLWSVQNPKVYRLHAAIVGASDNDAVNQTVGFRSTEWKADTGFHLNGESVRLRGFSHHNSFAGIGVAMPDRLNLFKVQASRALGGNIWRMSHNPYVKGLYGLLDQLGVLVWDENRDYGMPYVDDMHDMVKRDRNHPSIVIWSFCNEYECEQNQNRTGPLFRQAAKSIDPLRAVGANGNVDSLKYSPALDVQGHSHAGNSTFTSFHGEFPQVPQVLSECCSCTESNQRLPAATRGLPSCIASQNSPGLLPYVAGSLGVWTLFDYFGEQHHWPDVACPYGQFDIAGFPKPHAYWYRANWLANYPLDDPGRPPLPDVAVARVLSLLPSYKPDGTTTVAGVVSTAHARVIVDGVDQGVQSVPAGEQFSVDAKGHSPAPVDCRFPTNYTGVQCHGLKSNPAKTADACAKACCGEGGCYLWQFAEQQGCWIGSACSSPKQSSAWVGAGSDTRPVRNVTVVAVDASGAEVASHTLLTSNESAAGIQLGIDMPSVASGTGSSLYLDGKDVALVRASLVDGSGVLLPADEQKINITFQVASGPGRIAGIGNGDPASHRHQPGRTVDTYGGVARAVVQVTTDCVSAGREMLAGIDVDGGHRTRVSAECPTGSILVTAAGSANGHTFTAQIHIPVSGNPEHSPQAAAAATVSMKDYTYLDGFDG